MGRVRGRRSSAKISASNDLFGLLLNIPGVEEPESQHDEGEKKDADGDKDNDQADFLSSATGHGGFNA